MTGSGSSPTDAAPGRDGVTVLCPLCHSATKVAPNSFYGTGLAVHRLVRLCEQCQWMTVVREEDLEDDAAPTGSPPARRKGFRWFGHKPPRQNRPKK